MKSTEQLRKELTTRKLAALIKKVRPNPRQVGEDFGGALSRLEKQIAEAERTMRWTQNCFSENR